MGLKSFTYRDHAMSMIDLVISILIGLPITTIMHCTRPKPDSRCTFPIDPAYLFMGHSMTASLSPRTLSFASGWLKNENLLSMYSSHSPGPCSSGSNQKPLFLLSFLGYQNSLLVCRRVLCTSM